MTSANAAVTSKARATRTPATPAKSTPARRAPAKRVELPPVRMATVPDKSKYLDPYISRVLDDGLTDFRLFDFAFLNHENVLIEGPTGTGKTSAIMAWAAKREIPFYSVSSSLGLEPSQLFGKYIPDGQGGIHWQDGPVTDIVRHGGVLLLNEVNFIPARIGTVLYSLLDKRREIQLVDHQGEVLVAHNECIVLADMNPDYAGTQQLNAAFRNRFAQQLVWDYDPAIEEKLVGVPALCTMAQQFRSRHKAGDYETPVSTNMLMEFVRNAVHLGYGMAKSNFINHFGVDERDAVRKVIETVEGGSTGLQAQIEAIPRKTPLGDDYMDPDAGEYGKDWFYEDDESQIKGA